MDDRQRRDRRRVDRGGPGHVVVAGLRGGWVRRDYGSGSSDQGIAGLIWAGTNGFGIGSMLYAPGMTEADVAARARGIVAANDASDS